MHLQKLQFHWRQFPKFPVPRAPFQKSRHFVQTQPPIWICNVQLQWRDTRSKYQQQPNREGKKGGRRGKKGRTRRGKVKREARRRVKTEKRVSRQASTLRGLAFLSCRGFKAGSHERNRSGYPYWIRRNEPLNRASVARGTNLFVLRIYRVWQNINAPRKSNNVTNTVLYLQIPLTMSSSHDRL